jgi:hypothetical protein
MPPELRRIKHRIRIAYGYTDEQILEHIGEYGEDWALDAYRMIMEDEDRYWQLLLSVTPMARTPMDKKSGKALTKAMSTLRKEISKFLAPWIEQERIANIRARLAQPPKSEVYDEDGNPVDLNDPDWWKK